MGKDYPEAMSRNDFFSLFDDNSLGYLATIDGDQPRVRMMSFLFHKQKIWMVTQRKWKKVQEIEDNNKIEISLGVRGNKGVGAARITGHALLISDDTIRSEIASILPWFGQYFSSHEDGNFILYQVDDQLIRVDHPDVKLKYTVSD